MSDDLCGCEMCDWRGSYDDAVRTGDGCYICPRHYAMFLEAKRTCEHAWEPEHDEHGDPGRYCSKCHAFDLAERCHD